VNAAQLPATPATKQPPAAVKSVQIVHDKAGSAIEILTSRASSSICPTPTWP
jgi:hypothetical protein